MSEQGRLAAQLKDNERLLKLARERATEEASAAKELREKARAVLTQSVAVKKSFPALKSRDPLVGST